MKFIMVIIICFGTDCEAVFDKPNYTTYEQCYNEAVMTANYMKSMFPESAGEVHCWDDEQFSTFKKYIEDGGKPSINPGRMQETLPEASSSA